MAISHLCLQCGFDLARVRPQRDPHYGLPLVHCPKCETAAVRRRHPVWRGWRNGRRTVRSLFQFVFRVGFTLGLMVVSCGMIAYLFRRYMEYDLIDDDLIRIILPQAITLSLVTGFWLATAFRHGKQPWVWTVWMMVMFPALQLTALFAYQDQLFGHWINLPEGILWITWDSIRWTAYQSIPLYLMYCCVMVVALMGVPLGKLRRRQSSRRERTKWGKRRRKIRLARNS